MVTSPRESSIPKKVLMGPGVNLDWPDIQAPMNRPECTIEEPEDPPPGPPGVALYPNTIELLHLLLSERRQLAALLYFQEWIFPR